MASLKRKRTDPEPDPAPLTKVTRRATRHTPILPPTVPKPIIAVATGPAAAGTNDEETGPAPTKRRRGRTAANKQPVVAAPQTPPPVAAPVVVSPPKVTAIPPPRLPPMMNSRPRVTTQTNGAGSQLKEGRGTRRTNGEAKENVRPETKMEVNGQSSRAAAAPSPPAIIEPAQMSAAEAPQREKWKSKQPSNNKSNKRRSESPDRNIDMVVLGNVCFRAWYPSYYGKEVVGDTPKSNGGKGGSRRDRESSPVLDRLYVCPCCFKYSKELVMWWEHVRVCEAKAFVPGRSIYVHPRREGTVLVPVENNKGGGRRGREGKMEVVRDEGEWSIWEVDGEKDVLFCQNLSLFAKLFLDNKSVFFDVTGFKYYLLVHTRPGPPLRHHICGFFSKEKLSWDNNNLACILVFPPWQRKGLGSLLMGVSYEISRREGILGGPEKPISDLGRKGYRRFWAGEVVRWLLGLDLSKKVVYVPPPPILDPDGDIEMDSKDKPQSQQPPATADPKDADFIIDVAECSRATWITPEDCLTVLREMGVAEDAGVGLGKVEIGPEGEMKPPKVAHRVRIRRDDVRSWIKQQGISLERTCDPEGFVRGYAIPKGQEPKGD